MSIISPERNGSFFRNRSSFQIGKINLYLFFNLLMVIACGIVFEQKMVFGSIILETMMLLTTIGWIGLQGMDYRETLKLRLPNIKEIGVTLIVVACGIYIASFIELFFRFYLQSWGRIIESDIPRPQSISEYLLFLLALAILPALAEEVLFRGFILQNYRKLLSTGQAIFISALFFGIAHLNIYNFWGPFILGLLCGWLVCLFDSIVLGIIGHLLNNGLIITMSYLIPNVWNPKLITAKDLIIQIPAFVISGFIVLMLLLRYKSIDRPNKIKPGKLMTVLRHWTTWLIMIVFGIFMIFQLIAMRE
jgi:uncharacterized protein